MGNVERELYRQNVKLRKKLEKKGKINGLDRYLIFSFFMIIMYTTAQTVITAKTGVEQSTLTTCFFGVFGGEIISCALIKRLKLKDSDKNESEKNENE